MTAQAEKTLSELTDEELAAKAAELATTRTQVRLEQNAVQREIEVREATKNMSPETRRIVQLGLAGGLAAEGQTTTKGDDE